MTTNHSAKNTSHDDPHPIEIGDDLRITKTTRRAAGGGTWVIGTIAGHRFDALVFAAHADCPEYELDQSRISKLWLARISDRHTKFGIDFTTVANFDRGWDLRPTTETAKAIVDFLAAGLAEHVYHK
jgi:hypothetical protein